MAGRILKWLRIRNGDVDTITPAIPISREGIPDILVSLTDDELKHLEKKLVKRLDRRLLLPLALMYFTNFLDRANITTARIAGLQADLGLRDTQYLFALAICYVGYLLT